MKQNKIFIKNNKPHKICSNCSATKEITEYQKNWFDHKWNQLYKNKCKDCFNEALRNKRKYDQKYRAKEKIWDKRYMDKHREQLNAYRQSYRARDPEKWRKYEKEKQQGYRDKKRQDRLETKRLFLNKCYEKHKNLSNRKHT